MKMLIMSVKMTISKNKKMRFLLMSQGSLNPKIKFLGQKVCSVARERIDTHTHESDYCGHPFRVSGVFPSTYHQGSAQKGKEKKRYSFAMFGQLLYCKHTKNAC